MESLAGVRETGEALTRITDAALHTLIPRVSEEFAKKHGIFPQGGISVLAMGKYGGGELTHTSDIDIVFLYHCEDMKAVSDGEKPLAPSQYFSRLGQHIITAITALTPEGRLFEVDTRLRPSGSKGPLVVTLKTFEDYYAKSAWTWEHMALTRARVILVPDRMEKQLKAAIQKVLTSDRDKNALLQAVAEMRGKLSTQFGTKNRWAMKHHRGGLIDMEFICQYLMLREGRDHPDLFEPQLSKSIDQLAVRGLFQKEEAELMHQAHTLLQTVQSILRLCIGPAPKDTDDIPEGLRQILIQATNSPSFEALVSSISQMQGAIYKLYKKLIEEHVKE
ncbi:MAG: hypothetical protein KUG56_09545 [Kordiimonadaceae bacterium]|nr:hypothetical protein [Kordiimonadaceae bacterium]